MYLILLCGARFELLGRACACLAVGLEAGQEFALADRLQIQIAVVVLASGNIFGVFAVASAVSITNLEDGTDGAAVLTSDTLETDIVFATIFRVSVTAEGSNVSYCTRIGTSETVCYFFIPALRNLVSPHAHTGFSVVGKSGAALVARSFTVPAVPEHIALSFIREDAI